MTEKLATTEEREEVAQALERAAAAIRKGLECNITWFAYCPLDGIEDHGNRHAAETYALECTDFNTWGTAGDEWPEGMEQVSWGLYVPVQQAKEVNRTETPEGPCDYQCQYTLVPASLERPEDA